MARKWLPIAVLLALLGVGGVYLYLYPPLPRPPEIGRSLPANLSEANAEFKRRVEAQFPLPMSDDALRAQLTEQGFHVSNGDTVAVFEKRHYPCRLRWSIFWEEEDGAVTAFDTMHGGICL
ncbi:MAG: hypothetical protein AAF590_12625 [Pseudomonadota bacterium]